MSDFVSSFWSYYVAIITIISVLACGVFLWMQSRVRRPAAGEAVELKNHIWDEDLQEYNNPLPRWWMIMFYMTIVFSLGYLWFYPGLGSYAGASGWTQEGQYKEEMQEAESRYAPIFARYQKQDIKLVAFDPEARQMGERLFLTYCSQCHGSDARGAKGFPNLTDRDWLYGGAPEQIQTTIMQGRYGVMPPFGPALTGEQVRDVAHYVRSLSNLATDTLRVARGKAVFEQNCVACHGADAKGNQMIGAPNLTDNVWLYGSSEKTITETVTAGRMNQMPPHGEFLGEGKVHLLAAYVYGLSAKPGDK